MMFTVVIDCNNAAFADDRHQEVARLLRGTMEAVAGGGDTGTLWDTNGNRVGQFMFLSEDAPVIKINAGERR